MAAAQDQISNDIKSFIDKNGDGYSNWYVGISDNAKERLFKDHGVAERTGPWIFRIATSAESARKIKAFFVDQLGTQGEKGGGDDASVMVYAYRTRQETRP